MGFSLRVLMCTLAFFGVMQNVHAYVPEIVVQETLHDLTTITDPDLAQVFFGELMGLPHTYEIFADAPFTLSLQLRVPDSEESKNIVSGIVIKEQRKGRVEEITRLFAKDATWEAKADRLSGDTYREGASFEKELQAGVYRIEVQTPDNLEKYMLKVGSRDDMTIGFFELLHRLLQIKDFYGESRFWIIKSPYVYGPLLSILVLGGVVWYISRRRKSYTGDVG